MRRKKGNKEETKNYNNEEREKCVLRMKEGKSRTKMRKNEEREQGEMQGNINWKMGMIMKGKKCVC